VHNNEILGLFCKLHTTRNPKDVACGLTVNVRNSGWLQEHQSITWNHNQVQTVQKYSPHAKYSSFTEYWPYFSVW